MRVIGSEHDTQGAAQSRNIRIAVHPETCKNPLGTDQGARSLQSKGQQAL